MQRNSRRRDLKTRVESASRWHRLLLNAIANVAADGHLRTFHTPTAASVLAAMPRFRDPQPAMFARIYDAAPASMFNATKEGGWWRVDIDDNRGRILLAEAASETLPAVKTIAIRHDIEAGTATQRDQPALVARMNAVSQDALSRMLGSSAVAGVPAP